MRTILLDDNPTVWIFYLLIIETFRKGFLCFKEKSTLFLTVSPFENPLQKRCFDSSMLSIHCHQPLYCQNYHSNSDQNVLHQDSLVGIVSWVFCCGLVFKGTADNTSPNSEEVLFESKQKIQYCNLYKIYIIKSKAN